MIARSKPLHIRADCFYDPGTLVTADERKRQDDVTRRGMFVGVAQARSFDLYQNVC